MRARALLVAVGVIASACSSTGRATNPAPPVSAMRATTAGASTSAAVPTQAAPRASTTEIATTAAPLVSSLPTGACGAPSQAPAATGEVTFVSGGRLYDVLSDGSTARCLYELTSAEAGLIRWGPNGDRVLLGPATVAVGADVRPSGFFATNGDVKWSLPEGTRTFAATMDGRLKKRLLTDTTVEEISFLTYHEASVYHPAGRAVASVGTDASGRYGIFLADNNGRAMRPIAVAETAQKIAEPSFDSRGNTLYFLAKHRGPPTIWHVHALTFPNLDLAVLYQSAEPLSDLVASATANGGVAVRAGGCDPSGTTTVLSPDAFDVAVAVPALAGAVTKPIGWLDPTTLVIERFPNGCARPGDLWVLHRQPASAGNSQLESHLLVTGVDQPSVRVAHGPFDELPANINLQAPG